MPKQDSKGLEETDKETLEWIETYEKLDNYEKSSGLRSKAAAKIKENPFVPIGMLATTVALAVGIWSMKTGNKQRSQQMMRARVGAQGFTLAAILIGVALAASKRRSDT